MAFDNSGKYHMNPHHAKERDKQSASKPKKAPEGSPAEESSEPPAEASAEGDAAPPMQAGGMGMDMGMGDQGGEVSCPACGAHFPLELGLGQPQHPAMAGHGAVPTHESQGAMPALGGY